MPINPALALVLQAALAAAGGEPARAVDGSPPPDTVSVWTEEVEAGRYWHATRSVRSLGSAPLLPLDQLTLARAEGGWSNWAEVISSLATQDWLSTHGDAEGQFMLARAYEETGQVGPAAAAYAAFERDAPLGHSDLDVARVRRIRLLAEMGQTEQVLDEIRSMSTAPHGLSSWLALELARVAADNQNADLTESLLSEVVDPQASLGKWQLLPDLHLARGDTAGALSALAGALSILDSPRSRGHVWTQRGNLLHAQGDSAGAREAWLNALEAGATVDQAAVAAAGLLESGVEDPDLALTLARRLAAARNQDRALAAYALHDSLLGEDRAPAAEVRLDWAALLVRQKSWSRALPLLDDLARSHEPEIGAKALALRVEVLDAQRRRGEAEAARANLVRRFPETAEAAEIVFFQADAAHDDGKLDEAANRYQQVVGMAPESSRAALSWMRLGQIRISQGNHRDAVRVFNAYLDAQPRGPNSAEAAYWSAWSSLQLGDRDAALPLLERVRTADPISYYAVQTSRLLGEPFEIPVARSRPPITPPWLRAGLRHLDLLRRAGLGESEAAFREQLVDRARVNDDILLLLARELTQVEPSPWEGIRLGWEVRRRGRPWDRLLLEVIYPFPYRDMVMREAEEWGVNPFLVAGLIRQESAFFAGARSSADARGLMQVLPSTGGQLARRIGPDRFESGTLYQPDVNLHLGTAYLRDMLARYDQDLPLVLSAYNAGPHRATRWRKFPEAGDPVRFTERIPFRETRGYVKNVTRNMEVYRFLYGTD